MRKTFVMSNENFEQLKAASQPVMYMIANGSEPISPQESANNFWQRLGKEMGFKWNTARPVGNDPMTFSAEEA